MRREVTKTDTARGRFLGDIAEIRLTMEKNYASIINKKALIGTEEEELEMAEDNCIFCKIARGEIPSTTVYEDEDFRVILDLGPASKGHSLILPKKHFANVCELDKETAAKVLPLGAKIGAAMKKGLGCAGFNLVQNNGEAAGQTVMHFHMHVIPRYEGGPKEIANWVPGTATAEELTEAAEKIKGCL